VSARLPLRIEDYALIGDTHTAALVALDGSLDWLCLPRFDSPACFATLLGNGDNGYWQLSPADPDAKATRRYLPGTLALETTFSTRNGVVRLVDFMPMGNTTPGVVRLVHGVSGRVSMRMELVIRFDYGSAVPWVTQDGDTMRAVAGPDCLVLSTPVPTRGEGFSTIAEFTVGADEHVPFALRWSPSHLPPPEARDPALEFDDTVAWWQAWSAQTEHPDDVAEGSPRWLLVERSLITLKALTYAPTGGIVAAPTMSLPERLGGVRNWDYRYCWLRDATFTLYALLLSGHEEEAVAWRDWLLRAVAGAPAGLQIMYGVAGERRLTEVELDHLAGYRGSAPVRLGNAASTQFQLDVYGEIADAMHNTRRAGVPPDPQSWQVETVLLDFLEGAWREPDAGIWEVRGPRRHFTHSKVMAWVAFDRAVRSVELFGNDGPADRWRGLRDDVHREVCEQGFDPARQTFTQYYGSRQLDASMLMASLVGFLPPSDPRMVGTVAAVARELTDQHGLVQRYSEDTAADVDGLPGGEGAFLPCSFWLADNYALVGNWTEANRLFDQLSGYANDVGLLSEEVDPATGTMLGNFPQAFSHVALVNSAHNLSMGSNGPASHRSGRHHGADTGTGRPPAG